MNAEDARRRSDANLPGNIDQFIALIDQRIERVIETGEHTLIHPWSDIGWTPVQREAVIKHYHKNGFKITEHPNPDPGHPCSYTTLEW